MATTDVSLTELIINELPQSTLDDLVDNNNVPPNQLFATPDDGTGITDVVTQNSTDLITSGGVYNVVGDIEALLTAINSGSGV